MGMHRHIRCYMPILDAIQGWCYTHSSIRRPIPGTRGSLYPDLVFKNGFTECNVQILWLYMSIGLQTFHPVSKGIFTINITKPYISCGFYGFEAIGNPPQ